MQALGIGNRSTTTAAMRMARAGVIRVVSSYARTRCAGDDAGSACVRASAGDFDGGRRREEAQ